MHAFIFGFGYVGEAFARAPLAKGWSVAATARRDETRERLEALGITPVHPSDPAAMTEAVARASVSFARSVSAATTSARNPRTWITCAP